MQDQEKVTIVIATHDNVATIRRAIESATGGTRSADKIVVVDNDSTDGTYDFMCNLLGAKQITIDDKTGWPPQFDGELNGVPVKILRKRFSTTGHTLNLGMQADWRDITIFGFMDPTSWYGEDKIEQSIKAFHIHPSIACVISDCNNHYQDRSIERVFHNSFDAHRMLTGFQYDRNFLVRIQVFSKLQSGFNEQLSTLDDYDLLLRISEIGLIYHIPSPLHSNTVAALDESTRQSMTQNEMTIKQLTAQRRS